MSQSFTGKSSATPARIALAGISPHVRCKFVAWYVGHLHFVTDPLPAVPLVPLVPKATVLQCVRVRLAPRKLLAMQARVRWMAGVAASSPMVASASAAMSVVAFVMVPPTVTLAIVVVSAVGGGVAVGQGGGGAFGVIGVGRAVLLL